MDLQVGTILQNGKYRIEGVVGKGLFGVTYQGIHSPSNQFVALKSLSDGLLQRNDGHQLQNQFLKEFQRLSQCRSLHLPRVLHTFQEDGVAYGVTEWIPGFSLLELVKKGGVLPEVKAIPYIKEAAIALSILHNHGLLHRDIKPENFILDSVRNVIVLVDMGFVRQFTTDVIQLDPNGLAVGYAALEQYLPPVQYTTATDIYGLAATLFYLLTGEPPMAASFRPHSPFTNPRQIQPSISPVTEQAILGGMEIESVLRPSNVMDWIERLPKEALSQLNDLGTLSTIPVAIHIQLPNPGVSPMSPLPSLPNGSVDGDRIAIADDVPGKSSFQKEDSGIFSRNLILEKNTPSHTEEIFASGTLNTPPESSIHNQLEESIPPPEVTVFSKLPFSLTYLQMNKRTLTRSLGITMVTALFTGVVAGIVIRVQMGAEATLPFLNPVQTFPVKDWPGQHITEGSAVNPRFNQPDSAWFTQPIRRQPMKDPVVPSPVSTPVLQLNELNESSLSTPPPEAAAQNSGIPQDGVQVHSDTIPNPVVPDPFNNPSLNPPVTNLPPVLDPISPSNLQQRP